MLGTRSVISLCQFLSLQESGDVQLILNKHGIHAIDFNSLYPGKPKSSFAKAIRGWLTDATPDRQQALLAEIVTSQRHLRNGVNPKYLYEDR